MELSGMSGQTRRCTKGDFPVWIHLCPVASLNRRERRKSWKESARQMFGSIFVPCLHCFEFLKPVPPWDHMQVQTSSWPVEHLASGYGNNKEAEQMNWTQ